MANDDWTDGLSEPEIEGVLAETASLSAKTRETARRILAHLTRTEPEVVAIRMAMEATIAQLECIHDAS